MDRMSKAHHHSRDFHGEQAVAGDAWLAWAFCCRCSSIRSRAGSSGRPPPEGYRTLIDQRHPLYRFALLALELRAWPRSIMALRGCDLAICALSASPVARASAFCTSEIWAELRG